MKIIFTKHDEIGSAIIRWATGEPVSHCGILFDNQLLLHSSPMKGGKVAIYEQFQKTNVTYSELKPKQELSLEQEERFYRNVLAYIDGQKGYDWPAVLWLGYRVLLKKYFAKPIPKKNPWNEPSMDFCSEIVLALDESMKEVFGFPIANLIIEDIPSMTPWVLRDKLIETGVFTGA